VLIYNVGLADRRHGVLRRVVQTASSNFDGVFQGRLSFEDFPVPLVVCRKVDYLWGRVNGFQLKSLILAQIERWRHG
jgi:hypothetical protein